MKNYASFELVILGFNENPELGFNDKRKLNPKFWNSEIFIRLYFIRIILSVIGKKRKIFIYNVWK